MDGLAFRQKLTPLLLRYRYVWIVIFLGILLMSLPEPRPKEPPVLQEARAPALEDRLEGILSHLSGAGRVELLLTQGAGERTLYQIDEEIRKDSGEVRKETVRIHDRERGETGLIRQVEAPVYRGALVLCQGADHPAVRLAVVQAVQAVTGLGADRITVLTMK